MNVSRAAATTGEVLTSLFKGPKGGFGVISSKTRLFLPLGVLVTIQKKQAPASDQADHKVHGYLSCTDMPTLWTQQAYLPKTPPKVKTNPTPRR